MRLEHIPLIIGAIVALIGLGFIADGLMADSANPSPERRRRMRAERSRAGETIVGIGTLCMAAALIGRDTWRYGTLAVLIGAALVLIGIVLNRTFLKEALLFRGPARRADPSATGDSPHVNRSTRLGGKAPAAKPQAAGRSAAPPSPNAPPTASPAPPRPATASPRAHMAAGTIPTPVVPMRAVESPRPAPDVSQPSSNVERRKTPRGKQ